MTSGRLCPDPAPPRVEPHAAAGPEAGIQRARVTVAAAGLAMFGLKVFIAVTTYGVNDTRHWLDFARAVKAAGPIGVYAFDFSRPGYIGDLYNHPPLIGWLLAAMNGLGLSARVGICVLASASDLVAALVIAEMVRVRRGPREATAAGLLVALSPALLVISGFHGNTDPVFTMLALLATFLLADRQRPGAAGVVLGLSISVKILSLVAVPALAVYALSLGRRALVRFLLGFGAVVALLWLPAVASEWKFVRNNVLGYKGAPVIWWGLAGIARSAGHPHVGTLLISGRSLLAVVCAGIPALLVWRRPAKVAEGVAVSLCAVLLLSPASATQYLVWPLAASYLLTFWGATAYNLIASALLVEIYSRWNGGLVWNVALSKGIDDAERRIGFLLWTVLGAVTVFGLLRTVLQPRGLRPRAP